VPNKDVVVVGTSAGGIQALRSLIRGLPNDFKAALLVVMHTSPESPGLLSAILQRAGSLRMINPVDGEKVKPGNVYVAPADYHMLVEPGKIRLSRGPKENRFRPAIDPLFRSAAQVYGPRAIGVILTGGLDDGTAGLWAIKQLGGTAIVQDPLDALYPSMPASALLHVNVDYRLPLAEIPSVLVKLTEVEIEEARHLTVPANLDLEVRIAKEDPAIDLDISSRFECSSFTCPDCHGVLLKLEEGGRIRFRCHTGHAYSSDSLLASLTENIEDQLWVTVRAIEESAMLMRHIANHLPDKQQQADEYRRKADEAESRADLIRVAIDKHRELNAERITQPQ